MGALAHSEITVWMVEWRRAERERRSAAAALGGAFWGIGGGERVMIWGGIER